MVALTRVLYAGSPYGMPAEGTPATVQKFQRELFVKFHDANYTPNQTLIALPATSRRMRPLPLLNKYLGSRQVQVPASTMKAPAPIQGQHIWLIDKPDAVQTQIRVGRLAIPRADPNYIPLT